MGRYDDVELTGPERQAALEEIAAQMDAWGLAMPDVEPLPLDFGLGRFREVGETEFWIVNDADLGYCGKFLFLFDGQTCPRHYHEMKHETFFIVKGSIRMRVGEEERVMQPGDVLAMPPGTAHSFTGEGPALLLEVSKPCLVGDNFFEDKNVGKNGVI